MNAVAGSADMARGSVGDFVEEMKGKGAEVWKWQTRVRLSFCALLSVDGAFPLTLLSLREREQHF
jgi:hypothetical protein